MPLRSVSRSGVVIRSPLNPVSTIHRATLAAGSISVTSSSGANSSAARPVVVGTGQRIEAEQRCAPTPDGKAQRRIELGHEVGDGIGRPLVDRRLEAGPVDGFVEGAVHVVIDQRDATQMIGQRVGHLGVDPREHVSQFGRTHQPAYRATSSAFTLPAAASAMAAPRISTARLASVSVSTSGGVISRTLPPT